MTSNNRKQYRLDVEAFTLSDGETNVHFELDNDLYIGVDRALGNPQDRGERAARTRLASQAALVLVELGIDGERTHRVRLERTGNIPGPGEDRGRYEDAFNYPASGEAFILGDAIEALQAVLDQLLVMRTADEAREAERNAVTIGADAAHDGVIPRSCTCPTGQRCACGFNERMTEVFFGEDTARDA